MKPIDSADLVKYNANSRGTRTGDCSVRSISLAFDKDYREVKRLLNESLRKSGGHAYNSSKNILYVLRNYLGVGHIQDIRSQELTVEEFANNNPTGTYLIGCHKSPNPNQEYIFGNHLVTIINGKIFDTWDSRNYYVCKAIKVDNTAVDIDTKITSLSQFLSEWFKSPDTKDWWSTAFKATLDHAIDKSRRLKKLADDNDITITINGDWRRVNYSSFVFTIPMQFELIIPEYSISQSFSKIVKVQIKPSVEPTEEAVENYIYSALDVKISDIVWAIVKAAEDAIAGYQLTKDVQNDTPVDGFWNVQDRKMFNALPYWVRKLATDFYIDRYTSWGEPAQRIILKIRPLPNDPENKSGTLTFEAEDKGMLMAMLEHYKNTGNYDEADDIRYNY